MQQSQGRDRRFMSKLVPKVIVVSTGGTIASRPNSAADALLSTASGEELLASLGALAPDVPVSTEAFCNIGSFAMDLQTSFRLAQRLGTILADPEVAGVVVTHGTDTMEEAVFLADLVAATDKPIVFTGAQRHAAETDADGPRNLADSIAVAASPSMQGLGATIVFEGEIHAARDVTKMHASRVATFASSEHGKLGEVDAGRVILQRRPLLRRHIRTDAIETRVDLIRLTMGSDDRFMRCALAGGTRGIVLEAFGRGNVTPLVLGAIHDAVRDGVAVVVTSRCPQGRVMPLYGGSGGKGVAAAGAIFAGDLSGIKARILLALLLGSGETDIAGALRDIAG
jgi:L-asparaginase